MNKDLQRVADAIATIDTNLPQIRDEYVKGIEDSQTAQREAQKAKEEALTGVDFDNACDRERHATEREQFFKRKLEDLDFTPRMGEKEYFSHVATVQGVMEKAAQEYRKEAEKAMNALIAARGKYEAIANDADEVLRDLDAAANVLQSKYRYREIHFTGDVPSKLIEDVNEWTRHTVRFLPESYYKAACTDATPEGPLTYNDIQVAAWMAVDRVKLNRRPMYGV